MKQICIGILAHVDAGKTTLSEALLYRAGAIRRLGRVDHQDAFLDTDAMERQRGITIFSKQAVLELGDTRITLLDTPGHVDFSAEMERTLQVLDCAVLVISGTDGVQGHTRTLWDLLERYQVPTFLFINKMDLAGANRGALLAHLKDKLSHGCVDFGNPETCMEEAAVCDETALERYLDTDTLPDETISAMVAERKLFPCYFGSALKVEGVEELLSGVERYAPQPVYPAEFGAKVFKITRDAQGARLTHMKITGGTLHTKDLLTGRDGDAVWQEKADQLRLYSGAKFRPVDMAEAGSVVAVTGLSHTFPGQGLGTEPDWAGAVLQPVLTYRVELTDGTDPHTALQKLRQLEEEDPQLHIVWNNGEIHAQLMGEVQMEILQRLIRERLGMEVAFGTGAVCYRETIANAVEGIGHFEPLRHYAEVHLLLEPGQPGSGITLASVCPTDRLDLNWQRLIFTHLLEKPHLGVLTGSPITDIKITLLTGRAHEKHTEGGDFRQATYRAVRQGLMQAESVLLEPWYAFTVTAPTAAIGRVITDIRGMGGEFDPPEAVGDMSTLSGKVPAGEVRDYADTLAAFTRGTGRLQLSMDGYSPCHNAGQIIREADYDPEADPDNTPDSVFCAHGAGFLVKWDKVPEYMHLSSSLKTEKPPVLLERKPIDDRELEAIMEREFGPARRRVYTPPAVHSAKEEIPLPPPRQKWLLVDGYNILFAWDSLKEQAKTDLDAARRQLCDALRSYAGFTGTQVTVVFDGYRVKGNPGEKALEGNIRVVYTGEGETADRYLEELAARIGKNDAVWVASSDSLVQLSSFRSGVLRISARELEQEVARARKEMDKFLTGR